MMSYPLIYMIAWLVPTIVHIYQASTGQSAPFVASLIDKVCVASLGLVHTLMYGFNESSFGVWRSSLLSQNTASIVPLSPPSSPSPPPPAKTPVNTPADSPALNSDNPPATNSVEVSNRYGWMVTRKSSVTILITEAPNTPTVESRTAEQTVPKNEWGCLSIPPQRWDVPEVANLT
jgi:hypothetical protein